MNPKTARLLWSAAAIVLVWAILFRNASATGMRAVNPLSGTPLDPGAVGGGGGGGFGRPQLE